MNLLSIPKQKFIDFYLNNPMKETAKKFKISIGSVSKLAKLYDVSKNNVMR